MLRCSIHVPPNTISCCHPATEDPGILRLFQSKRRMEIVSCPNINGQARSQGETSSVYCNCTAEPGR